MPTTVDLTVDTVLTASAALLNDSAKSTYTNAAQLPYLNIALQELQELFELNDIPVTSTSSAEIDVDAGVESIGFSPAMPIVGVSYLPDDLIEPQMVWERTLDTPPWIPMNKVDILPFILDGSTISQLIYFVWESNELRFIAADGDNQIKINYIRRLFVPVTDEDDLIAVINAASFLEYRTAGLCARFIGENPTRGDSLDNDAGLALDRALGISTKGRQAIMTRRRPFRASYRRRRSL